MFRIITTSLLFLFCTKAFSQGLSSDMIEKRIVICASNNLEDSLKYYYNYAQKHNLVSNKMNNYIGDYYRLKLKYAIALPYYEAAYKNDSYNIATHYNLFVCYGFAGMVDQQNLLATKFTPAQYEFYKLKKTKLESVSFFAGTLMSNNLSKNKNLDLAGANKFFGSIDRNGTLKYLYASAQIKINNRLTFMASINDNNILSNQQFQYEYFTGKVIYYHRDKPANAPPGAPAPPDSIVKESKYNDTTISYKVSQPIIHTQIAYVVSKTLKVKFTYSVTHTNYTQIDATPNIIHDNNFSKKLTNNTEATIGLMAHYRKPHYEVVTRFFVMPFSNYNLLPLVMKSDSDRIQFDLSATYFPFQKNTFSVRAQASYLNTQNSNSKFVYTYEVNAKLAKKIWLNALVQHNNLRNLVDLEGAVVYNIDDVIQNKFAVKILYYLGNHIELSAQYGLLHRNSNYTTIDEAGKFPKQTKFSYNNQLINGGLKWIF